MKKIKGVVVFKSDYESEYKQKKINQIAPDYIKVVTEEGFTETIGAGWINNWQSISIGDFIEVDVNLK